ncbi:MAG: hypothetical protein BWY06_03218 [Candidatus Latescibacteria bacterium ADurb.Bin168]|nr:MAG: hypothetical protein BWY06_03218 [Candidatus Latescibacteria bacterium ADurb.Bin168]
MEIQRAFDKLVHHVAVLVDQYDVVCIHAFYALNRTFGDADKHIHFLHGIVIERLHEHVAADAAPPVHYRDREKLTFSVGELPEGIVRCTPAYVKAWSVEKASYACAYEPESADRNAQQSGKASAYGCTRKDEPQQRPYRGSRHDPTSLAR